MRLIDADALYRSFEEVYREPDYSLKDAAWWFFGKLGDAQTITPPPNAPLTLEELREMDGEPAYFVNIVAPDYSFWGIVMVDNIFGVKKISTEGKTFCVHQEFLTDQSYGKFWLAYRRKPKEGTE